MTVRSNMRLESAIPEDLSQRMQAAKLISEVVSEFKSGKHVFGRGTTIYRTQGIRASVIVEYNVLIVNDFVDSEIVALHNKSFPLKGYAVGAVDDIHSDEDVLRLFDYAISKGGN